MENSRQSPAEATSVLKTGTTPFFSDSGGMKETKRGKEGEKIQRTGGFNR